MSNLEISRAERLDQYVVRQFEQFPDISRAMAAKLITQGKVTVNNEVVTKPGYKIRPGEVMAIDFDPELAAIIPDIDINVLYEDNDCVVIEKPLGLLTHSKGAFNPEATVATWLRARLAADLAQTDDINKVNQRAGIVHRLDRATSGVMICAKNQQALTWLQKQFSQRRVKKTYMAIVTGAPANNQAIIDMPIERNPRLPQLFRVGSKGKVATTDYKVVEQTDKHSLVELKPFTGRTHQLRVHLSHIGHPIVGDTFYGGEVTERMYLHALQLEVTLPNHERKVFESPLPATFTEFLAHD